ncbi:hypothetical protein C8J57DRAFT_1063383, partial [Mycena rebaudengoi]
ESAVSDVYVQFGDRLKLAVSAYSAFDIDTTCVAHALSRWRRSLVPGALRNVLEECLSEDASAEGLELYLPAVRGVVVPLLQVLQELQAAYRRWAGPWL